MARARHFLLFMEEGAWRKCGLRSGCRSDLTGLDGGRECRMIALGLVGVGRCKCHDRGIERVPVADITGDHRRIAASPVRACALASTCPQSSAVKGKASMRSATDAEEVTCWFPQLVDGRGGGDAV